MYIFFDNKYHDTISIHKFHISLFMHLDCLTNPLDTGVHYIKSINALFYCISKVF